MRPLLRTFMMFLRQIKRDSMLYAVCFAPVLAAVFFKFGIPFIEEKLCSYFNTTRLLADYYPLFDLFLSVLTPFLLSFASAMVMLTERDENMAGYIAVTPVGKSGYVVSRLVLPAAIAFVAACVLLRLFSLSGPTIMDILLLSLLGCVLSVAVSLLIVSFSHNRVEGMALAKLTGIVLLGLPVPYFIFSGVQYLFSPLPSFWMGKMFRDGNPLLVLPALLTSGLWLAVLFRRFKKTLA